MKKLFFAICFNLLITCPALSRVTPISGYDNIPQTQKQQEEPIVKKVSYEDFKEFIGKQFKTVIKADPNNINHNIGYMPSLLRRQQQAQEQKSFFQKIYDEAIERVSRQADTKRDDIVPEFEEPSFGEQPQEEDALALQDPGLPVIKTVLPGSSEPVAVPALEHIPYLMNLVEVLPNGLVKFEETIVVIANGEKLRRGLSKILPAAVYNAQGKLKRLDYSIIGVTINDMPIEYRLAQHGRNALLIPQNDYTLDPGIYTYKFEYLVDNLLWEYDDFYQFYWDLGGNGWNLVIDRLGGNVNLPAADALLSDEVFLGSLNDLSDQLVIKRPNGRTATTYIAARPLLVGEGMPLVTNIAKSALMPETLWQKVVRSFYTYGDIYLSLLGLVVIVLSFALSWRYIAKDKAQLKIQLPKTAMLMRYLMFDRFDVRSVCGFLLELYKKNIIDIQQAGDTILLIKRTDNLKSLQKSEQKALRQLFPSHETTFAINRQNLLPFKRFAAKLETGLKRQMFKFRLKLNAGYLLLSLAMLVLTEVFIASFKLSPLYAFGVMLGSTLSALAAMALWRCQGRWLKIIARLIVADIIVFCLIILSAVIHPLAALILLSSLAIIVWVLNIYSRRRGLIKHYIREIADFKDYLIKHHDNIVLSKDFLNYQAAIWSFDLDKDFVPSGRPEYNKLPAIADIAEILSGKR